MTYTVQTYIKSKSVAQSIPTYYMSVYLFPSTLEDELQQMMNSFWWDSNPQREGINWLSWDKMIMKKEHEGMWFRQLHAFNLVVLGKQGQRI